MTHSPGAIIRAIAVILFMVCSVGWFVWYTVRKSDDPARMLFKWVLTAGMLVVLFVFVGGIISGGTYAAAFVGVPAAAACGIVFAIIWRHSITGLIAKPFGALYDGGDTETIPHPAYSVAQSRQKQGKYLEAIIAIREQLQRFPKDVEGQMLLAQIEAEDMKDIVAAERTIQRFCDQPGHAAENVAFALYSLADWQLSIGRDQEAARKALQQIVDRFPGTEFALGASHRIAHLGDPEMLLDPHERKKFVVKEKRARVGLMASSEHLKPAEIDPAEVAAGFVRQLEAHPQDTEAREQLAIIYADHYGRIDMATEQMEQMIGQPGQPPRQVARWLNMLADLQVRSGVDYDTVKATVERIIDNDPKAPVADIARNRLALLKLEFKARETKSAVKMGTYEENVGLKQGGPARATPRYRPMQ